MAVDLSVNLNKIALLRNSREGNFPNLLEFGRRSLSLGANGLTVHPRPDQRHIRNSDILPLGTLLKEYPGREFNIEGNPFASAQGSYPGFLNLVMEARPNQCTLVPDGNDQLTSDHGFDLRKDGEKLSPILSQLRQQNIRTSLFMDPDLAQIELAKKIGAERIELYTGPYAWAFANNDPHLDAIFDRYSQAAKYAGEIGLGVNAGHDLNLTNLPRFVGAPYLLEISIGHALTVDALSIGWDKAITSYLDICQSVNP